MADRVASEAVRTLHGYGFATRTDPTTQLATVESPGRADVMAAKGGRAVFIEIKNGRDSFPFGNLRDNQREWAERYCLPSPYSNPYWIWLSLGGDPPHRNPEKYKPRKTWLLPYDVFLDIEATVKPIQMSLVYRCAPGMKREIQDRKLDAINLLSGWELTWEGNSTWGIPDSHPFNTLFIGTTPLVLNWRLTDVREETRNVV